MRDPKKSTISSLLLHKTQYVIPKYQRAYDWQADREVSELFQDILSCIEADTQKELFLGTSIVDISGESMNTIELIDGQQRLTTTLIFLIALRVYASNTLENPELVDWVQDHIVIESPFPGKPQKNKLVPSESIGLVFDMMCKKNWNGKFPTKLKGADGKLKGVVFEIRKIKPIFNYLLAEIESFCMNSPLINFETLSTQLLDNSYLIVIEIEDKTEAFEIFERTNARGRGLEVSDLIKNYLFSKEETLSSGNVENLWKTITINSGNSMLRMLKYFWISRRGYVSKRDLYSKIRSYAEKIGINQFTDELLEFSSFFHAYNSNDRGVFKAWLENETNFPASAQYKDEFVRIRNALRLFKITQVQPVIFSSLKDLLSSDTNTKKIRFYINFLRFLEGWHFVNNKISTSVGNEVEKIYAEYSELFFKSKDDFSSICQRLRQYMEKRYASQDEYLAGFSNLSYDDINDKHLIRYIFDQMVNINLHSGQRLNLFDYFDITTGSRPNFDIDHLHCQKSGKTKLEEDVMHEIGNLMVIPRQINSILGADDFKTKMDKLLNPEEYDNNINQPPNYVTSFARENMKKDNWLEEDIKKRTSQLAIESFLSITTKHMY